MGRRLRVVTTSWGLFALLHRARVRRLQPLPCRSEDFYGRGLKLLWGGTPVGEEGPSQGSRCVQGIGRNCVHFARQAEYLVHWAARQTPKARSSRPLAWDSFLGLKEKPKGNRNGFETNTSGRRIKFIGSIRTGANLTFVVKYLACACVRRMQMPMSSARPLTTRRMRCTRSPAVVTKKQRGRFFHGFSLISLCFTRLAAAW